LIKIFLSPGLFPIYLGDDQTDEDAFQVMKKQGISVYVGPRTSPSEADFFLKNPEEVQEFLFRCQEARRAISCDAGFV
jgi:trehalose-phosphatase